MSQRGNEKNISVSPRTPVKKKGTKGTSFFDNFLFKNSDWGFGKGGEEASAGVKGMRIRPQIRRIARGKKDHLSWNYSSSYGGADKFKRTPNG